MSGTIVCMYCGSDQHFLCNIGDKCCCKASVVLGSAPFAPELAEPAPVIHLKRGPKPKDGALMKDAISSGRKRAAVLYPILPDQICEWAWQENCGAGAVPVLGCSGRKATHIHHGPDKSVLNNAQTNISIICTWCHNLWHAKNDAKYKEPRPTGGEPWLPFTDGFSLDLSARRVCDPRVIVANETKLGRNMVDAEVFNLLLERWLEDHPEKDATTGSN